MKTHPIRLARVLVCCALVLQAVPARGADCGDGTPSCDATGDYAAMSLAYAFGGAPAPGARGLAVALTYGSPSEQALLPALVAARLSADGVQAVRILGVDPLAMDRALQAEGDQGSYRPWVLGGLVGLGAAAIVVRYLNTGETPPTDLSGGPNRD